MSLHSFNESLMPGWCICGSRRDAPNHGYPEPPAEVVSPIRAVARRSDPDTSWEAARSVTNLRKSQEEVYAVLAASDGLTDEQIGNWLHASQSPSGLRTRRAELVARGLVVDSGKRRVGPTGRRMIVWAVR